MRKILIWTAMPMMECPSPGEALAKNLFGTNTGNLLFLTAVARTLMPNDETVLVPAFEFEEADEATIERINAEFDCFAIPLANAFRDSYMYKLRRLTAFVKRLKIPCVVIGVGIQASVGWRAQEGFAFDETVREFVRAVLERSAMLGVRGRHTADYLKHLGFSEEKDFTVIGCPSMYMRGGSLPEVRRTELSAQSAVCINGKIASAALIHEWMGKSCEALPNYWYVPQRIEELWMMLYGVPVFTRSRALVQRYIPLSRSSPVVREKRSVGFVNVYPWLDFMKGMDFSYGCNIHGNIAAMLTGVPCMVIERDLRVRELAEYADMPLITMEDMRAGKDVRELYARADFDRIGKGQMKRFDHYVDFLNNNGLKHFDAAAAAEEAPYDRLMRRLSPAPACYARTGAEILRDRDLPAVYFKALRHYRRKLSRKIKEKVF